MNRDNVLFVLLGLLAGFIGGYLTHEVMVQHQPPPATRLAAAGATAAPGVTGAPGGGAAAAPGAQPAMEQVQRLRQYVQDNPQDTEALRLLANLNYDIQNWSRAVELYGRFLEVHPDDVNVRTDLGASLRFMDRHQEALAEFDRVLQQRPDHWQALYNQILVLAFNLGDFEAAGEALERLQVLQPSNPEVGRLAAEIERRRGS